ncbi:MAG: hypothetical protein BWY82_01023 [Verrucomicrobia bacterium ADurb.Bin474]|nr:MAG: hypothetical protein BWY82_01023 [Verrucomicrobia bacterium ADurb.Bin474]
MSIPLIAVPIRVTATIPMITPRAVSKERIRCTLTCSSAMRMASANSYHDLLICDLSANHFRYGHPSSAHSAGHALRYHLRA